MMRHLLLFTCLLIFTRVAAQDYNKSTGFLKANSVWIFGNNAGYNFNTHTPIRQPMNSEEGCSSMADPNTGELLFYSDGRFCWNKNRVLMSGSYSPSLSGNNINNGTTSQGACIVPFINDKSKYYIFSLEPQGGYGSADGAKPTESRGRLYYSVLDMELNNGLGNIDTLRKNIFMDSSLGEMMIAVPGNNCDIWLLVHTTDSAVFKAYNINSAGVNLKPIISRTGAEISGKMIRRQVSSGNFSYYQWGAYAIGQMAISPDRTKLVLSSGTSTVGDYFSQTGLANGVLLCNFDASMGLVSDAILVDTLRSYGVAFSPDKSKLYTTWNDPIVGAGLNQYDVSNFNVTAIKNSQTLIKSLPNTDRGLRLYNDTIYLAFGGRNPSPYVHRINNPNLSGISCNVQDSALVLATATSAVFTFPNDVVLPYLPDTSYNLTIDTTICAPMGMFPAMDISASTGYTTFNWQDGDTTQNRNITDPGIYWVKSTDGCHSRIDTFKLQQVDFTLPVISININELATVLPYYTYQWLLEDKEITGATQRYYNITSNGNYRVITSNGKGCMDTSEVYEVRNYSGIGDVSELSRQIRIHPNPATEFINVTAPVTVDLYLYSIEGKISNKTTKANQVSLEGLSLGIYFLNIYDLSGRLLKVEKIVKQ